MIATSLFLYFPLYTTPNDPSPSILSLVISFISIYWDCSVVNDIGISSLYCLLSLISYDIIDNLSLIEHVHLGVTLISNSHPSYFFNVICHI